MPTLYFLLDSMQIIENEDSDLKKALKKVLHHYTQFYFDKYIKVNLRMYSAATFLDVRLKMFSRLSNKESKAHINMAVETIEAMNISELAQVQQSISDTRQPLQQISINKQKMDIFDVVPKPKTSKKLSPLQNELNEYKSIVSKDQDPILFWNLNQTTYPCLFYGFKRIACIPASSVPVEQLFSHCGYNIWDRRNRLSPETADKMMVIYENL